MDYTLRQQLRQQITYASVATLDTSGNFAYGTGTTCYARVEPYHRELAIGTDIVEERSKHMMILDPAQFKLTNEQAKSAIYTLSGETQPRRAKEVHYCYGERGVLEHIEVVL